ncbi:MAG TPA: SGNH/GDSL hydrolase family protein [Chloroflexota bacterium]|nr:SGNH/GDSL hydrolase family protein [Chloroflexota bacterium]
MEANPDLGRDWNSEPFRVLVAIGDAVAAGGDASRRELCWAEVLAALITDFQDDPVRLVNVGLGGNIISTQAPPYAESRKPAADERAQKHVIDHQPDLLVIGYGLNDCRGGTPVELFQRELTRFIDAVRRGCDPLIVLTGPNFVTEFTSPDPWSHANRNVFATFNLAIEQVARATNCLFCEIFDAAGGAEWLAGYSRVHPNDLGHRLIAHQLFQTLAHNCSGLATRTKRLEQSTEPWRDESVLMADYGYSWPTVGARPTPTRSRRAGRGG